MQVQFLIITSNADSSVKQDGWWHAWESVGSTHYDQWQGASDEGYVWRSAENDLGLYFAFNLAKWEEVGTIPEGILDSAVNEMKGYQCKVCL